MSAKCRPVVGSSRMYSVTGGPLRQLLRELDALRLAAGQGRRALAEAHIGEAHVEQGLELRLHGRHGGEKRQRILDRHVEHFLDVLALEAYLQRLAVVAHAAAHVARHVHVGEKMHLDLDDAVALTRLASPAFHVEAEAAGLITARARLRHGGKDFADGREQPGVRGGIGSWRAADRALIDLDHPIDMVEALEAVEMRIAGRRVVELGGDCAEQRVVDERRLT